MKPARPAAPRRSGPATPVVVLAVVAAAASAGALLWLVGPGRSPAHPYAAQQAGSAPTPVSQSYELGSGDVAVPPPSSPTPVPTNAAEQAALAAAAVAGSDAAQVTADGIALTGDDAAFADNVPASVSSAAATVPTVQAAPSQAVVLTPAARAEAPWAPPLAAATPAADLLGTVPGGDATGALQAMAQTEMLAYGYGADQWGCLDSVISRESGWHVMATNLRSGAYGLPQALPATKLATAGADWQTNPRTQLAWMLDYVHRRYGDPCGAWAHELSDGWY